MVTNDYLKRELEVMNVEKTDLDGVLLVTPPTLFEDWRGEYIELYNHVLYQDAGIGMDFVQDDISTSTHHVLRGIHGDRETWKLVSCLVGRFYLLVVNNDPQSVQYKQWISFTLSEKNRLQVLIPPGFGNGHVVLSELAMFHYKQTSYYNRAGQFTILWDDPTYDFWWPVKNPLVSRRDAGLCDLDAS